MKPYNISESRVENITALCWHLVSRQVSGKVATYPRRQPPPKTYRNYGLHRQEVREDFNGYCAYCGIHESEWPHNQRMYEIDHFKPQNQFEKSDKNVHNFYNLRWCCRVCNATGAKGEIWPTHEEQKMNVGFVDLTQDDWHQHYAIESDGRLKALTLKAEYTIEVIGLNGEGYVEQRLKVFSEGRSLFQASGEGIVLHV